jgi:hypothetical protein
VPRAAWTSRNSDYVKEEWMDVFCGIDWAEDVRHEVACCE